MATEQETQPRKALADLLREVIQKICIEEIRVCLPATVVAYSPGPVASPYGDLPAMVEVEIDLKQVRIGHPGDADEEETATPIAGELSESAELSSNYPTFSCPVLFPGPASMWARGAIELGEQGLVIWSDRELGQWLVSARNGSVTTVDPKWSLSHGDNLSSGYFLPGAINGPNWPASVPSSGGKIGPRDDTCGVLMDAGGVLMDADAGIEIAATSALDLSGLTAAITASVSASIEAPMTTISNGGAALGLAKNAQILGIISALTGGLDGLPAGPITDVQLKAVSTAIKSAVLSAIGTTTLVAQ